MADIPSSGMGTEAVTKMKYTQSVPVDIFQDDGATEDVARLRSPGGLRRHFLNQQADEAGVPEEKRPAAWKQPPQQLTWRQRTERKLQPLLSHRAEVLGMKAITEEMEMEKSNETNDSSNFETGISLVKSFVGSGIMVMPGAFASGGYVFSTLMLIAIAGVSGTCIRLLIDCQLASGQTGFGEIATKAGGRPANLAVQISLVVSQFGTCTAYVIFGTQLVHSMWAIPTGMIVFWTLPLILPLCLLRSVSNLKFANLLADFLIVFGLAVIFVHDVYVMASIADTGPGIVPFNPSSCSFFIGIAIFTFEGIPMILPIRNAMAKPQEFWGIFCSVFAGLVSLFTLFGLFGYFCHGNDVKTVILLNLPVNPFTNFAKMAYIVGLLLGLPLMFLPGARITELWVFGEVETKGQRWQKSLMRVVEVILLTSAAYKGQEVFATFLSLVGSVCCAPIAFIYPALFHLSLVAQTKTAKALDCFLITFGVAAMSFTLVQVIMDFV